MIILLLERMYNNLDKNCMQSITFYQNTIQHFATAIIEDVMIRVLEVNTYYWYFFFKQV